jgi:hypothetical protein
MAMLNPDVDFYDKKNLWSELTPEILGVGVQLGGGRASRRAPIAVVLEFFDLILGVSIQVQR